MQRWYNHWEGGLRRIRGRGRRSGRVHERKIALDTMLEAIVKRNNIFDNCVLYKELEGNIYRITEYV